MGTISPLDRDRARAASGRPSRPARLTVTIEERDTMIRLRVNGARTPTRLYLYVDGDLADMWIDVEAVYELQSGRFAPGPHAITARAVDSLGRWGGASTVVETAEAV